jgi:hypothetical protein
MIKYILLMKEAGEGCDYTIGCTYRHVFIEAEDDKDATEKAKQILHDYGTIKDSERLLEEFEVFKLGDSLCDISDYENWVAYANRELEAEVVQEQEDHERAEYLRLHSKFKGEFGENA